MSKVKIPYMIKVMQSFEDGKTIQVWCSTAWKWVVDECPTWNWNSRQWRVKPGPRVIYVNEYEGELMSAHHNTLKQADAWLDDDADARTVKFIEVLDDKS